MLTRVPRRHSHSEPSRPPIPKLNPAQLSESGPACTVNLSPSLRAALLNCLFDGGWNPQAKQSLPALMLFRW